MADRAQDLFIAGVDIRDVAGCSCLRLRKAARRATQIYESHLRPTGLTIGQFGVLAYLYGVKGMGRPGLAMGELAERLGMDPTTLKRVLGPLLSNGLAVSHIDPQDRRYRLLAITAEGCGKLAAAIPLWKQAQRRLHESLGVSIGSELDRIVEAALSRLSSRAKLS